jgi:abhydrolase domain-containing protein 12
VSNIRGYSNRLQVSVLAIDYRGFADSTGTPTEDGLALDARAAWDWLLASGAKPDDIVIVGNSLGTGVAAKFAAQLAEEEGEVPRGVALISPFSSIRSALDTYNIFGFLPLMKPLAMIPGLGGMPSSVFRSCEWSLIPLQISSPGIS